jgi:hypothetical protein
MWLKGHRGDIFVCLNKRICLKNIKKELVLSVKSRSQYNKKIMCLVKLIRGLYWLYVMCVYWQHTHASKLLFAILFVKHCDVQKKFIEFSVGQ